jgi:hypothetical protein
MSVSARSGRSGACGVVVGYRDDKNYTVFRWAGPDSKLPFRGRQQVMRYDKARAHIISDEPLSLPAGSNDFARVTLRRSAGMMSVLADGKLIAQMVDESLRAGRPGLWAQSAVAVEFRDPVMFFPPEPVAPKVAPKMEEDALMVGWASPSGEWPPTLNAGTIEYWNTGEFFGDATVEYPWDRNAFGDGKLEIALRTELRKFESGYIARFEGDQAKNVLRATLLNNGAVLKQAEFDWKQYEGDAAKPTPVRIQLEGRGILLLVGGTPVLSHLESGGKGNGAGGSSRGTRFAARAKGFPLKARDLRATSALRDDYTFTEAPTDWYAPQGEWSVISRWPCYSDWSFFGGHGLNPVLWSKRTYGGDTVVEFYAHSQMDLPKEIGYSHPGDLNVTIGGDGKNVSSGYSFVIAGWDNTKTRVLKGTRVVAENTTDAARFVRPINHNPTFHKRWYYIRAEVRQAQKDGRNGVQVRLTVDDALLADYFDPSPLPALQSGGRVAIWTVDSTIMVARVKIESETVGSRMLPSGLLDAAVQPVAAPSGGQQPYGEGTHFVPRPVLTDGLASALVARENAGDSNGDAVFTVRNPTSGGEFAVRLEKPDAQPGSPLSLRATPKTQFEMDVALPPEVNVDLYATIGGVRHLIPIDPVSRPDARVRLLAAPSESAARVFTIAERSARAVPETGKWRHVSFDLGAALKKLYPNANTWSISELAVGALHGDTYRWLGFGGNPLGATYSLRGAKLTEK